MIGKQVSMKSIGKSDFSGLVKYITDEQQKNERVGAITVSNCHSNEHQIAMLEIMNTQALNTRATSDKTYHLIISFRAGEQVDDATLKIIESRICEGLGFGEHQRISAVHHDTDNLHIHLAINKIHPTRYTIHDPYNDYKAVAQLCEKLEQEFNLQVDNHKAHQTLSENRANDMERHSGIQSFLGWVKQECTEQIKNAQSWSELHDVLRANGLEIQERANGLVITDGADLGVKASSVAREFSKSKLESRLGAFEAQPTQAIAQVAAAQGRMAQSPRVAKVGKQPPPSRQNRLQNLSQLGEMQIGRGRRYEPKPIKSKVNTVELYAKYKAEQQNGNIARAAEWAKAQDKKNRLIEGAKRTSQLKRAALKAIKGVGPAKKLLYASISKTLKDDIQKINKQYAKDRQEIYDKFQRRPWADWLRAQATAGDQQALGALRAREAAQALKGNTLEGGNSQPVAQPVPGHDSITKKGTVIYRLGETAVRDDGNKLNVSRGANQGGLQAALKMAMERYGDTIKVAGTEAFKEQVAKAAAAAKLPIIFADAALERRRQELLQTTPTEKKHDARNSSDRPAANRGRTDSRSHVSSGLAATRSARARSEYGRVRGNGTSPGTGIAGKPNVGRVGRKPPPQSQNRLREMSELGVVRIASRSEVLLPRDVPNHVEQQGAKPIDGLRRNIFGPGLAANPGQAAADKYIAQREATRLRVSTISKHARYNYSETAADTFVGIRNVDNQTLALLKRGEEVMVLPIDDATARRLKRVAVGEVISVTPQGLIKTRGRSR